MEEYKYRRGAAVGMVAATALLALVHAVATIAPFGLEALLLAAAAALTFIALSAYLLRLLLVWLSRRSPFAVWGFFTAVLLSALIWSRGPWPGALAVTAVLLAGGFLLGAGLNAWLAPRPTGRARVLGIGGSGIGVFLLGSLAAWLLWPGASLPLPDGLPPPSGASSPITLPDPGRPGPYAVRTLTYGSGEDRHRPAYGEAVDLVTASVDGRSFLAGWTELRTRYWGFGPEALPRNGRVWYPDGDGPFPLVLIVHGNHEMAVPSAAGYAYLGELFAGQGYVVVSVDQSFLNGSDVADWFGYRRLRGENDARAWLLLEHLELWQRWTHTAVTPFGGKIDMDRIALIGHSRGGEAVAIAAAFNRLPAYPEDANVAFDYHFAIRAVAALAPTEGQYRPGGGPLPLADVNYLLLHGDRDLDVSSVQGADQYHRLTFSPGGDFFKAIVRVSGANHSQFNTVWPRDKRPPRLYLYNRAASLSAAAQQAVAGRYLGAFLAAALREERSYRALFRDPRVGADWLPPTRYLAEYADSHTRFLATYEEDLDPTTLTAEGGTATGKALRPWRERTVPQRRGRRASKAVFLGWDEAGETAYSLAWPEAAAPDAAATLVFTLGDGREPDEAEEPLELSLAVSDAAGETAVLPLSHFASLPPRRETPLLKASWLDDLPTAAIAFHHFRFPLADFAAANPALDPARLTAVHFHFDRTPAGTILLDDVGFWQE